MAYEGIVGQLIATPILLLFFLNFEQIFLKETNNGQRFFFAILISTIITSFGEGLLILVIFTVLLLMVNWLFTKLEKPLKTTNTLKAASIMVFFTICISPIFCIDSILWNYYRLNQKFVGGALHYDWSLPIILTSLPYIKLSSLYKLHLFFTAAQQTRLIQIGVLLFLGLILLIRKHRVCISILTASLTLLVFTMSEHRYATWKVAILLQPFFTIILYTFLLNNISSYKKSWILKLHVVVSFIAMVILVLQYSKYADKVHMSQFFIKDNQIHNQNLAIITPSNSRIYYRLASIRSLNWVNLIQRPLGSVAVFNKDAADTFKIALYFDCDAEGLVRCEQIMSHSKQINKQREVIATSVSLKVLLNEKGVIDSDKLSVFILKFFAVSQEKDVKI
jgi:hypothetical protein